ncbi:rCG20429 [Rattus norvegicus]|uniref:RCG20429 n=1 Tax=Rattus norvegicus TaxID=10116 RepID=A6JGT7_RAT|nr:rCG20429 [Rattus norvegicus]
MKGRKSIMVLEDGAAQTPSTFKGKMRFQGLSILPVSWLLVCLPHWGRPSLSCSVHQPSRLWVGMELARNCY